MTYVKIVLLSCMILLTGCNNKPIKKEPLPEHPVLKSKEDLKKEMIEDIKQERVKRESMGKN